MPGTGGVVGIRVWRCRGLWRRCGGWRKNYRTRARRRDMPGRLRCSEAARRPGVDGLRDDELRPNFDVTSSLAHGKHQGAFVRVWVGMAIGIDLDLGSGRWTPGARRGRSMPISTHLPTYLPTSTGTSRPSNPRQEYVRHRSPTTSQSVGRSPKPT